VLNSFSPALLSPVRINTASLREEMLGRQLSVFSDARDEQQIFDQLEGRHVILGVPDDRGVALNLGHTGAASGPDAFRQAFYRLYDVRMNDGSWCGSRWVDAGDIILRDDIGETHAKISDVVHKLLTAGAARVYVIGGGHDFSFGSYAGHARSCQGVIPILNFDAHFDLRPVNEGIINSGTPFRRVIENLNHRISDGRSLFEIGIQRERNPQSLWDYAMSKGVSIAEYTAGRESWIYWNTQTDPKRPLIGQISDWIANQMQQKDFSGHLHLSVDLDVFHVAAAMGTSASTSFGLPVETLWPCVEDVLSRKMCRVVDVAELCPARDQQMQTARLAAALVLRGALSLESPVR
jgi:formiminoglutamase